MTQIGWDILTELRSDTKKPGFDWANMPVIMLLRWMGFADDRTQKIGLADAAVRVRQWVETYQTPSEELTEQQEIIQETKSIGFDWNNVPMKLLDRWSRLIEEEDSVYESGVADSIAKFKQWVESRW